MSTFQTPAPIAAVLDVPAGRIQVIAADRADTTVEIRPADASRSRDVTAANEAVVDYADGVLRVAVAAKNQYFGPAGSVEVTVQLPAGSGVEVTAAGVEVRAVGRVGELALTGAQADVSVDEAAGARVDISAGDVTIGRLTGPADITTVKGDIRITEARRGTVTLRTTAGNVTVGAAAGVSAAMNAHTGYGHIEQALRNTGESELDIHATTAYGDIVARSL